jgi:hypothetical protein
MCRFGSGKGAKKPYIPCGLAVGVYNLLNPIEAPMYEGPRDAFLIENMEDRELITGLLKATWGELPYRENKKSKENTSNPLGKTQRQ